MKCIVVKYIAVCLVVMQSVASYGGLSNGSFENGTNITNPDVPSLDVTNFNDWNRAGNVYASDANPVLSFPSLGGARSAVLSTSDYANNFSGAALEGDLGLANGAFDSFIGGDALVGSVLFQTFNTSAGGLISFNWNFLTSESPSSSENDGAFVVLDGIPYLLANTNTPLVSSLIIGGYETGTQSLSLSISSSGNHTIGFAVVDEGDKAGDSFLVVDEVSFSAIPETSSVALLSIGFLFLGIFAKSLKARLSKNKESVSA